MRGVNSRKLWISIAFLAPVYAFSADPTSPVCSKIQKISRENPVQSEFLNAVHHLYRSCGTWLAHACTSPSRRADPTEGAAAPEPSPSSSAKASPLADASVISGQNHETTSCKPSEVSLPDGSLSFGITDLTHCLPISEDRFPVFDFRTRLAETALRAWKLIQDKRNQDLITLMELYSSEGIEPKFSPKDIQDSVKTLMSHVHFASTRAGGEAKNWQAFISDQIADAGDDIKTQVTDENGKEHIEIELGFFNYLSKMKSDEERFSFIVARSKEVDDGDKFNGEGHLSPYHAKMLLTFLLENRLRSKYKDKAGKADAILSTFASKLHLKSDMSQGPKTQWQWVIPHDGFMLGASFLQMHQLLDSQAVPEKQHAPGTGIDCATFAQNMLISAGFEGARETKIGRLTSVGISYMGKLNGIATVDRMTPSLAQTLAPGDMIIEREKGDDIGHVQIVVGYDGDPPKLVVVSAEGGYQRSIIKRTIDIFPEQPKSCGLDYFYNSDPSYFYFRAQLEEGPKK